MVDAGRLVRGLHRIKNGTERILWFFFYNALFEPVDNWSATPWQQVKVAHKTCGNENVAGDLTNERGKTRRHNYSYTELT